ncbi:hypothetical protein F5X99DRAFT_368056 [Biscogniauxia marginata]|nr:hypothetical protein F5X99DRAFT_368056 [Biscogniauxia marginata]
MTTIVREVDTSSISSTESFPNQICQGSRNLNRISSFEQGELANLHAEVIRDYETKHSKRKGKSHAQDFANRAFNLLADVYNKLQHLMEGKIKATNRTPFRRREWQVVVLKKGVFQIMELLPERRKKGMSRRKRSPAMRKWFVVLRGEGIKSTKEGGWKTFNRPTDPW